MLLLDRGGLDESLFRRLSEAHPRVVVNLSRQYRMNEDIMLLSNHLIYEGRLQCGTTQIAKQVLTLPKPKACLEIYRNVRCGDDCWLQALTSDM